MSDAQKPTKKSGKGKKLLLIGIGALVLGGGGVGAGLWASGAVFASGVREDPNKPKLVPRDDAPADKVAAFADANGKKKVDPTLFTPTYYPIKDQFTANLRDSDGFMQIGLGVSTFYDQRVVDRVTLHEMAVRSAVLMTLADQDTMGLVTPEGKEKLKGDLRDAINDVLIAKEGFGGIDDVYFTSFVVQ